MGVRVAQLSPASRGRALNFLVYPDLGSWKEWQTTGMPNRPTHLLRALARRTEVGRILLVDPPRAVLREWIGATETAAPPGDLVWTRLGARMRHVEEKIFVLEPPAVPPSRVRATHGVTTRVSDWFTRKAIDWLGLRPFVLFFGVPYNHRLIGRFEEALAVFDESGADWLAWCTEGERPAVEEGYERIRACADVIVAGTAHMSAVLSGGREAVYTLPNAIDATLFDSAPACPADLAPLAQPRLGYVGTFGERVDETILAALSAGLPSASLVLIGPEERWPGLNRLRTRSNVTVLGPRPHASVPDYLAHFDVCLLPHRLLEATRCQSSMKFYEYLAAGKPIVSTPVSPALEFASLIYLADSPESFTRGVGRALAESDPALPARRRACARAESWERRADTLLGIIDCHLAQNGTRRTAGH